MNVTADACIIGGGVIGLATAYYLTKQGKTAIVVEANEIGSGASGSCDDMILLQSKKPGIALRLAIEGLEMYRSLVGELGRDIGFETRGGMVLIEDEKQYAVMEKFVQQQIAHGLDVRIVDRTELRKKQPHVSGNIMASTYSPTDSQVDPLRLMRVMLHLSLERGLQVRRASSPVAIEQKAGYWQVVTKQDVLECGSVVIAAGAWSKQVGGLVGIDIPIEPRRGQLAITEGIPAIGETNVWTAAYIASKLDKSLMPDKGPYAKEVGLGFSFSQSHDGNYLIGSTREAAGYDKKTSERAISIIVQQAQSYFPVLKNVSIIRTISGFRPASTDGNPIIGPVDGKEGLFIAAGHEGDGVALAPITGKAIADMIMGRYDSRYDELNLRRFA